MVQQQMHGEMTIKIEIPYETVRKHMVPQGDMVNKAQQGETQVCE